MAVHGDGGGEALAAGGGAAVQQIDVRLGQLSAVDAELGGGVLDVELTVSEGLQLLNIAGAAQHQTILHPAVGLGGDAGLLQLLGQSGGGGLQGVDLDHSLGGLVVGLQHRLHFGFAQIPDQQIHQHLGMAVLVHPGSGLLQGIFFSGGLSQDGVDQSRGVTLFFAVFLGQSHGFVHRSAVRHPVQLKELVQAQMENIVDHGVQILDLAGEELLEVEVQLHPILEHAVAESGGQTCIAAVQAVPDNVLLHDAVGPGALFTAGDQGIQGGFTCAHISPPEDGPGNNREQPSACRPRPGGK